MKIAIIGTGYVGLVTGTCLAEMGHLVTCVDVDGAKIDKLKQGEMPFYEPGLEEMVKRNARAGRLLFTTEYAEAIPGALFCLIAVPTPSTESGSADLRYVFSASDAIAAHMNDYCVIINKSTVPAGTAFTIRARIQEALKEQGKALEFDVVANPEFLKQGSAIQDFMKPDRIILGVEHARVGALVKELYSPFSLNNDRIFVMDILSAEMTKYAANAMLATRISFMNELAGLCEKTGADINMVRRGIGADNRIGSSFLYAGLGFGGSCFPKDIRALQDIARSVDYHMKIIEAVETTNERQKKVMSKKIVHYFSNKGGLQNKRLAIWGLSFKPDTDDLRDAPSLNLIEDLLIEGAHLHLYDPIAMENARSFLTSHPHIKWCANESESVQDADGIVLVTEWKQFRFLDFKTMRSHMRGKVFFDGRNQYKRHEMALKGFDYISIGQPIAYADESNSC